MFSEFKSRIRSVTELVPLSSFEEVVDLILVFSRIIFVSLSIDACNFSTSAFCCCVFKSVLKRNVSRCTSEAFLLASILLRLLLVSMHLVMLPILFGLIKVPVVCGKCMECRKQKAREWRVRLHEELRHNNKNVLFVTLSFSEQSLIELD